MDGPPFLAMKTDTCRKLVYEGVAVSRRNLVADSRSGARDLPHLEELFIPCRLHMIRRKCLKLVQTSKETVESRKQTTPIKGTTSLHLGTCLLCVCNAYLSNPSTASLQLSSAPSQPAALYCSLISFLNWNGEFF